MCPLLIVNFSLYANYHCLKKGNNIFIECNYTNFVQPSTLEPCQQWCGQIAEYAWVQKFVEASVRSASPPNNILSSWVYLSLF